MTPLTEDDVRQALAGVQHRTVQTRMEVVESRAGVTPQDLAQRLRAKRWRDRERLLQRLRSLDH